MKRGHTQSVLFSPEKAPSFLMTYRLTGGSSLLGLLEPEACGLPSQPLPDVEEVVIDHKTNRPAVEAHIRKTIDRIIDLTPQLARRLVQTER